MHLSRWKKKLFEYALYPTLITPHFWWAKLSIKYINISIQHNIYRIISIHNSKIPYIIVASKKFPSFPFTYILTSHCIISSQPCVYLLPPHKPHIHNLLFKSRIGAVLCTLYQNYKIIAFPLAILFFFLYKCAVVYV